MRLIKYDEEGKESRAKRDLTFARRNEQKTKPNGFILYNNRFGGA